MAVSTSPQRTYRYLRIGIAGTVVVIFVGVGIATAQVGVLTSISDYYYTPARSTFVGALVAASLALFALSGRGSQRILLDAAALFAPLIALIPTTLAPTTVPDVVIPCRFRCFPPEYEAEAATGIMTYLLVGAIAVFVVLILAGLRQVPIGAVAISLTLTVGVLVTLGIGWAWVPEFVLAQGHFIATIAFFGLFALVAIRNAFPRRGMKPRPVYRDMYVLIAVLLVLTLVAYGAIEGSGVAERSDVPFVLLAEVAALVLFFLFWVTQCAELWNEEDPRTLIAR
ncbi:hypothetical protein [Microbacterium sp. C7(2022)]|uniref:hypothetical protein n=1 Tax=Microbacterium sp. C7(2022) TaxID=2992759 RepID=UPI00237B78BC|nr:hypothetical protein [Microbacterium sp. C7(2022)]MDE0545361.1 hypothetical protein [Microbacterium sp. C7(2022)]